MVRLIRMTFWHFLSYELAKQPCKIKTKVKNKKLSDETPQVELDSPQKENIDKILNLLDEIRDPFAGQSMPAMIGLEYLGSLQTI